MLELKTTTTVTLAHVQSRKENHGEQLIPAIDLALTLTTHNRVLDALHPQLRGMLFCVRGTRDDAEQPGLDLPISELPNVRVAAASYPIKLEHEQHGARLAVEYGIDDDSGLVLDACKLHKFRVTPIEGGSVEIKFAVSSSADIDEHVIGLLSMLQQQTISVTLTMPEVVQGEGSDDAPKTPEQAFIETAP